MPGPSNTLLIEGSFSELAEELSQYIDTVSKAEDDAGLQSEVEPLLATIREAEQSQDPESIDSAKIQSARDDLLKKIVIKASVLNSAPEKGWCWCSWLFSMFWPCLEFTAAYNLLISLSSQSSIQDQLFSRLCQYLQQPITSAPQHGPSLAVATLSTIFNVIPPESTSRYHLFLAILKVIRTHSSAASFDALIPQLETNLPTWLALWQFEDDEDNEHARDLHTIIADVGFASGNRDLGYKYLLNALDTIPPPSASDAEFQSLAKRALIEALTNPSVTDFTPLTASDAVQSLRRTESTLFELLEIFSSDDYASYADFLETNSHASLGINDSAATPMQTKMRLLTLATIAASAPNRSVSYSAIASALQIPSEDVEMWVIDTIRAGLVEGKLSQLKQEFLVQRATYRVFGEKQWAEIQGRLMVWRRSLESVLTAVRGERERFLREGPGGYEDQNQQGGQRGGMNGYNDGGQRRQGGDRGGRRNMGMGGDRGDRGGQQQQMREVDVGGE
jgi:translation initiation factor 3 subunit M